MSPRRRVPRVAGLALLVVAATSVVGFLLLPLAAWAFVRGVELTMAAVAWLAMSLSTGVSVWSLLPTIGRALGQALTTPRASVALGMLVLVAVLALVGLQRLLGSDEESSK